MFDQIAKYFDIGLIVVFILIILGLLLAALRGYLRGVWKSTHNMIFMLALIFISIFTLNALTDFVGSFPISNFIKGSFYLSREIDGQVVTYYVPITTLKETLREFIQGFYTLYNVSASATDAADFAIALSTSLMKIVIFLVDMLLIVTLGNLLSLLSWYLIFRHFIPATARRTVKLRWVGLAETAVTYLVVLFMFMSPFTAIVNSLNQSYQKNHGFKNTDDEMVVNIGNFIDAYNNSLFAKVFFNWTVDDKGMTLDTRLFNNLTTGVSGNCAVGLVSEFVNVTNIIVNASSAVSTGDGSVTFDFTSLISKEIIDNAIDVVINSGLISSVLPIVVELAMNSDLLQDYVPGRLVDLSDVKWNEELGYVRDMVDCVFDSGAIDSLFIIDENGKRVMRPMEGTDLVNFIEEVVYSENFDRILDIFKAIDKSKVLSRALPAVLQFVKENDESGAMETYLPLSWEELNELSWGFETFVLFDFLHSTVELDQDFMKAIFIQTGLIEEDPNVKSLPKLIHEHSNAFKQLVVGKFDASGELINVDKRGQTEVFKNGERIKDDGVARHYCLFDMNIVNKVLPTTLDQLFDLEGLADFRAQMSDEDLRPYHEAVAELNNGVRIKNYKKEFDKILDVVATAAEDEELVSTLFEGKGLTPLMADENNFFSIKQSTVTTFQNAIRKMDKSNLLYTGLAPFLKTSLKLEDVYNTLNDIGLKSSVIASAIDHDMKKTNHTLFEDVASLLDNWSDLNIVSSLAEEGDDSDALLARFKEDEVKNAFVNVLDALHDNPLINPTPEPGDDYSKNENLYGLLLYVFENTKEQGLVVTRETLEGVEASGHTWHDENAALGGILQFIANRDLLHASTVFDDGELSKAELEKLYGTGTGDYDFPGLFPLIDNSHIFSTSFGPFLDDMFSKDSFEGVIVNKEEGFSFTNVTSWKDEGDNIRNLLISLHDSGVDLANFDFSNVNDIVELNAMLHSLANSGIFTYIDQDGVSHYQFGKWLYDKIDESMGTFTVDENDYDLLADPKFTADSKDSWDVANWGARPEDSSNPNEYYLTWKNKYNPNGDKSETKYIAYRDFVNVNGMDDTDPNLHDFWCKNDEFLVRQEEFKSTCSSKYTNEYLVNNDWGEYFGSDVFVADYTPVFDVDDEISRVMKFMVYAMRLQSERKAAVNPEDRTVMQFDEIPTDLLRNMLYSLNDTYCMRMGIYNFYRIAQENVFDTYGGFSLDTAHTTYVVDAGYDLYNYELAQPARQEELDKLIDFYSFANIANEKKVISGGDFNFDKINGDSDLLNAMEEALLALKDSHVFHRDGSRLMSKTKTPLQSLFVSIFSDSDISSSIYIAQSPKDSAATNYTDADSKIDYLVMDTFREDARIENDAQRTIQTTEIQNLVDIIDKLYSLKDKDGKTATSITDADMNNAANIEAIKDLLDSLNESDLLYDVVPNSMYNIFIGDPSFTISYDTESVSFAQVDPFYHYYYDTETYTKRPVGSPDFTARYAPKDITGIQLLMTNYQNYNDAVGEKDVTDCRTLMSLTGSVDGSNNFHSGGPLYDLLCNLHDYPIFHTPARNYDVGLYYTNKFEGNGYTLFEEMMDKICKFVGLDDFAYDSNYDAYASSSAKLNHHVKAITAADDNSLVPGICYHKGKDVAWKAEIDSIMEIAYRVADMSKDPDPTTDKSVDIDNFELKNLEPNDVKTMLRCLNSSDLVGDAVPGFVEDGFDFVGLNDLTTYSSINYSYYRLGQKVYGGDDAKADAGTEIDNIYHVMLAFRNDAGDGYVTNLDDITDFVGGVNGQARLDGLMKFIYESRILNTSQAGVYDEFNTISSHPVSARGLLLFNSLGDDLTAYVARRANDPTTAPVVRSNLDKISTMSKILDMNEYGNETYEVESSGLKTMIDEADSVVTADTFATGSIDEVKARKDTILAIVESAYNAKGATNPDEYKRSAIVSEFISGLLNNILENEYAKIDTAHYAYQVFSFGDDNYETLSFSKYSSLNVIERNGLEGIIDALDYIDPAVIQSNATNLKLCFAKMGEEVGKNSNIGRAIYLGEVHGSFKALASTPYFSGFPLVDDTSNEATSPNNVYSNSFFFAQYGEQIETYLNSL